jgi:hypothetical protein
MRYYDGVPQEMWLCEAVATSRDGTKRQCRRKGRGNPRLCYQHFEAKEVEIPPDLEAPPPPPLPCASWPDPHPGRLSREALARERRQSLRRQREREERRTAEYRKRHPRKKGWQRIRFGGNVRIGKRAEHDHFDNDLYLPPRHD